MAWSSDRWRAWLVQFARDWAVVVALGAVALLGVAKVGEDVFAHESTGFDAAVQSWVIAHENGALQQLFLFFTNVGGPLPIGILSVIAAVYLWYRHERRMASAVLVAPVVALALFSVVKRIYARPRPAGLGGLVPSSYSFPSGHATSAAAVFCTLAYVYWREGLIGRRTAIAIAIIAPLLIGLSRIYLNVHWATDVLGGWSAGLLIAVLSSLLYDRQRLRTQHSENSELRSTDNERSTDRTAVN